MLDEKAASRYITERRLAAYGEGDVLDFALRRYEWNIALSAAVYESLHRVEVALRNAMDRELALWNDAQVDPRSSSTCGRAWLIQPAPLLRRLLGSSWEKAHSRVAREIQSTPEGMARAHSEVLVQLPFSTWRFLLPGKDPGRRLLWVQAASKAFPGWQGDGLTLTTSVAGLVTLRNRVAHLEPIIRPGYVERQFAAMRRVAGAIDPAVEAWLVSQQRISAVLHRRPKSAAAPKRRGSVSRP